MMTVLATTGRDVVLRNLQDGTAVINVALAYNIGYGQNKKTQWIETSIFGKRAETLADYLPKGTRVMLTVNEVHIDEYVKQDGTSTPKLVGRFVDLTLAGSKPEAQQSTPPKTAKHPTKKDDPFIDSEIPF
jgi:single-strand DNA-binding protein